MSACPTFKFVRKPTPQHPDELTDIDAAQLQLSGKLYHGTDLPGSERLPPADTDLHEEGPTLGFLERWDVYAGGDEETVLYDAWLYMVDSGTVFRHGTTEVVSEVIQFGFDPPNGGIDPAAEELCEALGAAYNAAQRAAREGNKTSAPADA